MSRLAATATACLNGKVARANYLRQHRMHFDMHQREPALPSRATGASLAERVPRPSRRQMQLPVPDVENSPPPARSRSRDWVWLAGAYLLGTVVLLLGIEPAVFSRYRWDALNNFDLGIYSRALYLISWDDLNPWLTNRATKIFNDHFDPVLLLVAPWVKLGDPARLAIAIEALIVVASGLPILWLYRRGAASASVAGMAIAYLLLNRATISAVDFPVHPTTWAMLPMTWLGAALLMDRRGHVVAALTLLMMCKEEFPFLGVMLAAYYLSQKQWRLAALIGGWSGCWMLGTLVLRPLLLGEVQHHAAHRFVDLSDPVAGILQAFDEVNWQRLAHVTLPLAPLCGWMIYQRRFPNWALWMLPIPLVLIRFLAGAWTAHYLAPVAPLWLLGLLPRDNRRQAPAVLVAATIALLIAVDWGPLARAVKTVNERDAIAWAPHDAERKESLERARNYLLEHTDGKALVQSNLVPRLVTRPEIYQVAGSHDPAAHEFRYVFVERAGYGDPWPLDRDAFDQLLAGWRSQPRTRVIIDDGRVFLAEGNFRDRPR